MMTASGLSSLRRDAGQIGDKGAGFLADDARLVEGLAQALNELGLLSQCRASSRSSGER